MGILNFISFFNVKKKSKNPPEISCPQANKVEDLKDVMEHFDLDFKRFAVHEVKRVKYHGLCGIKIEYLMLPIYYCLPSLNRIELIKYPSNFTRIGGYDLNGNYDIEGDL